MFCGRCGSHAGYGDFCSHCGDRLNHSYPKKKWFWSFLVKTLLVLLVAGSLIGYGYYSFHNSLTNTIAEHFNAIRNRNITEAYYNYASKELQKAITLDSFRELVTTMPVFTDNASVNIVDSTLDYPYGTVKFVLISNDSEEVPGEYKLYRESGKWKIYDIQLNLPDDQMPTIPLASAYIGTNDVALLGQNDPAITTATTISLPEVEPRSSPEVAPIANQLDALKLENYDKAYHAYVSSNYASRVSFDEFKTFVQQYPILTKFKSASFKDVSIKDNHGTITVILDPNAGAIPINYVLVKENNDWLIDDITVNLSKPSAESPQQITLIVQKFLQGVKQGESVKVYSDLTSKKFQEITPYNVLQEFIRNFSILTEFQKIDFVDPIIKEGVGTVTVTISNQRQKMDLLFTLGVEDTAWKIWGVKLLNTAEIDVKNKNNLLLEAHTASQPQIKPIEESGDIGKRPFSSDVLDAIIQAQLKDLSDNAIEQAYEKYSSKEFKQSTPLDVYADFIEKYPALQKHKSVVFDKLVFNNNIPTFTGTIIGKDDKEYKVEYDFVKEDESWKILHMLIAPKENAEPERRTGVNSGPKKPLEFVKALIGNAVDKGGVVQDPKTVFKANSGNIYVNLYIQNGVKGTRIEMEFKHLDSGSSIPPISTTLQEDGSAIISYDFTNPSKGWPKGSYSLLAQSSTGENKEFLIRIE